MAGTNSDQDQILHHAMRWAEFGGGSREDIFVTFGVSPREYYRRLASVLARLPVDAIDRRTWVALSHRCTNELISRPIEPS